MRRMILLLGCVALAACDDDSTTDLATPTDLTAPSPDDLARPLDMAAPTCSPEMSFPTFPPPDAGGFCDGTPLAGTCAQAFFAHVASCFNPAGCCLENASMVSILSWQSGAYYRKVLADDTRELWQGGTLCASNTVSLSWSADDGSGLPFFDPDSGELHCPDGSQINVGAYGQCPALHALLLPTQNVTCLAPNCCVPRSLF